MPHEINLRRGQGVGLVDEVAARALRSRGFSGEGAGRLDGERTFVTQRVKTGGGLMSIVRTDAGSMRAWQLGKKLRTAHRQKAR